MACLDLQQNKGSKARLFGRFSEPYGLSMGIFVPYSDHIRTGDYCFIQTNFY